MKDLKNYTKQLLKEYSIKPKPEMDQSFMIDEKVLNKVVNLAKIKFVGRV